MSQQKGSDTTAGTAPRDAFEPYIQLIRSLLPRASSVALFDTRGELRWSSETTTGPDLPDVVEDAINKARTAPDSAGQLRVLAGNIPVYLYWLRDDSARLLAILAVVCRPTGEQDGDVRSFSFAYALLRPALECLRRDLMSRLAIDALNRTVTALDKDLELLLADGAVAPTPKSDEADDLKGILQQATEHLHCATAALIVPDKSIALARSRAGRPPDTQLVARVHRQLLSMAQMRREPLILNKLAPTSSLGNLPYRILACPLRSLSGRTMGVLALFREESSEEFTDRDARLGDILARKAVGVIESSYDALSGLYTRPAFEQRVRGVVGEKSQSRHWTALYIDVDQLHVINDNFGMHVGDTVLGQIGEIVRDRLPRGAFGARISGDRFALLLPTQLDDAEGFAESLRLGVEKLGTKHGDSRLHISISVGVALLDTEIGRAHV